jgi:hypothetical protein
MTRHFKHSPPMPAGMPASHPRFIRDDGVSVPLIPEEEPQTGDSRELTAWLAAGNEPGPYATLDEARAQQHAKVNASLHMAIEAGVSSDALGAPHRYPMKADAINALTMGLGIAPPGWRGLFFCFDDQTNSGDFRWHDLAQGKQLLADLTAWQTDLSAKMGELHDRIEAAASLQEIESVTS